VLGPDLGPEFGQGVHRWIDVPSQPLLSASQRRHDVLERWVTDDEQVDVARGFELTTGRGPEHERHEHALAEGCQRLTQQVGQSGRFGKQALKLRKDRRRLIGPEVDLPPLNGSKQQPGPRQLLQLPLRGAERSTRISDDLAKIEGLVGMA
jgi:hypothetical protein